MPEAGVGADKAACNCAGLIELSSGVIIGGQKLGELHPDRTVMRPAGQ